MDGPNRHTNVPRRRFLAAVGAAGAFAGCLGGGTETDDPGGTTTTPNDAGGGGTPANATDDPPWYGSGPGEFEERPAPGGTPMEEMPDLSGTLNVYSGRGEALIGDFIGYLRDRYPDFDPQVSYDSASALANRIVTEGSNTPADVFFSVNAGALGYLAGEGLTATLSEDTTTLVPTEFRAPDETWVGTSGRARTVPFNTNSLSSSDVPDSVMDFPDHDEFAGSIGWAPSYSSFQGFVTAMRILEGEDATREWLAGMQALDVQEYADEFQIVQAVADGEIDLGFANHYYTLRVQSGRPNAPIDIAFTSGDAGSVFNVAGAATIGSSQRGDLADAFVRHLLSSEAQEFFAVRTFEYPLVEGVDPVGQLPPVSELDVPDIDLSELSNLDETVDILQAEGVL